MYIRDVQNTAQGQIIAHGQISRGRQLHFYNILFVACKHCWYSMVVRFGFLGWHNEAFEPLRTELLVLYICRCDTKYYFLNDFVKEKNKSDTF